MHKAGDSANLSLILIIFPFACYGDCRHRPLMLGALAEVPLKNFKFLGSSSLIVSPVLYSVVRVFPPMCSIGVLCPDRLRRTRRGRTLRVSWASARPQVRPTRYGNTTPRTCCLTSATSTGAVSIPSLLSIRWKPGPRRRTPRLPQCHPQVGLPVLTARSLSETK